MALTLVDLDLNARRASRLLRRRARRPLSPHMTKSTLLRITLILGVTCNLTSSLPQLCTTVFRRRTAGLR